LKYNGFALKKLNPADIPSDEPQVKRDFNNEVKQLKRFGGHSELHLVFLLASFELKNELHFLFPHAECDLSMVWNQKQPNPPRQAESYMVWFQNQILGIIQAVQTIHREYVDYDNSASDTSGGQAPERRWGRHGDIRPPNVLWFQSTTERFGTLVLSDMGLSTFNRIVSRSNQSKKPIHEIPVYHPPEAMVKGGKINRKFDVWSLGCLLLEMIAWVLGNNEYRVMLENKRKATSRRGGVEAWFYEIGEVVTKESSGYGQQIYVMVKEEVIEVRSWSMPSR